MIRNADGKVMDYAEELAEAFTEQMLREKPDALLIAGDLTFNGEADSHRALVQKLQRVADAGIPVFALPSNHDLNNPMAVRYRDDCYERMQSISGEKFAGLYAPFGYDAALSRDDVSLSYAAELVPGLRVLFVDQVTDLHVIVHQQGNGPDVRAVECFADDTAANGVAVQPDEQIEQGGAVAHLNILFAVQRAEDLLRKVERVVFALFVGQARIKSKIFQRQGIFLCQRAGGS